MTPTSELLDFIQRVKPNIQESPFNAFLDRKVDPAHPERLQRELARAGHPEFQKDPKHWPSLYLSTQDFLNSPYHQNIHFDSIQKEGVSFQTMTIKAHHLFNLMAIQKDPLKELKDWMVLRAMDEDYETGILSLGEEVWMLDAPSEQATIDPIAKRAYGKVVTFGLGIGYFLYMASLNPKVKELTVVESNPAVIDLFKESILPQFDLKIPLTILQGDAKAYFNQDFLAPFDVIFVDIHQSSDDGLEAMSTLLERTQPLFERCDFWIESSCTEMLPALMLLVAEAKLKGQKVKHPDPWVYKWMRKIDRSLEGIDLSSWSVDQLKTWIYDPRAHRKLLGIKL